MIQRTFAVTACLAAWTLAGCPDDSGADAPAKAEAPGAQPAATPAAGPGRATSVAKLVVLSGRKEALVGPLIDGYRKASGVEVVVDYAKTSALAMRLVAEGARATGDVVLAQEVGYLGSLAKAGLLAPAPEALMGLVGPAFRDPGKRWVGVSGRLRVLVGGLRGLPAASMPKSLKDLADPAYKGKLGWAPGNASMHAHVSVLRHLWGEADTEAWLKGMMANEAKAYPKNSPQVRAAADGVIALGWVNHYYLHKLGLGAKAANYSFPTPGDAGNVMMVAGAGVLASAKDPAAAWRLVEHLVSEPVLAAIARDLFEYPARVGVGAHPDVPPLDAIGLARFDASLLAEVGPTLAMLRRLGLQ